MPAIYFGTRCKCSFLQNITLSSSVRQQKFIACHPQRLDLQKYLCVAVPKPAEALALTSTQTPLSAKATLGTYKGIFRNWQSGKLRWQIWCWEKQRCLHSWCDHSFAPTAMQNPWLWTHPRNRHKSPTGEN